MKQLVACAIFAHQPAHVRWLRLHSEADQARALAAGPGEAVEPTGREVLEAHYDRNAAPCGGGVNV